jgi:hypothetical protein
LSLAPDTGPLGEELFQQFVTTQLPTETLEQLTGDHSYAERHPDESGLMKRVRHAWTKPAHDLTCSEIRTLVLQKFGLEWLAPAVLEFVTKFPTADCGGYPGDLTVNSLLAWRRLYEVAPADTMSFINSDLTFLIEEVKAEDPDDPISIVRDGVEELSAARSELAGG